MEVELRLFATVREAIGQRTLTREFDPDTTVGEVLAALEADYPSLAGQLLDGSEVAGGITVLCNGTHVTHLEGTETVLTDGDALSITPPVTGG
jgi:molybdopterin synthase sulfur carrier subunit